MFPLQLVSAMLYRVVFFKDARSETSLLFDFVDARFIIRIELVCTSLEVSLLLLHSCRYLSQGRKVKTLF